MQRYYADLHVHIGLSENGKWIKIPTSRKLTVRNVLAEALHRKGMNLIGIVDALSPLVIDDLETMIDEGLLVPILGGGYRYLDRLTVILGAEIETMESTGGRAHTLIYLPDIDSMIRFSQYMSRFIRNINLSSQNAHMSLSQLINIATDFKAEIVPAHVFTPHKSIYGSCCNKLSHILSCKELASLSGIELGLSADSQLADRISELANYSFVTNSDAHSVEKIAREYSVLLLDDPSFKECFMALWRQDGRKVHANYGLDPRLGKYHRTVCGNCGFKSSELLNAITQTCPACGSKKIIRGVLDRICEIADFPIPHHPEHRVPYFYQIPLEYIPGLGNKAYEKLLAAFSTEMNVLHVAKRQDLVDVVGEKLAAEIDNARLGRSIINTGGGGIYGKVLKS